MDYGPAIIRDYLYAELQANALIEKDHEVYVYRGERQDYLIEINVHKLPREGSK